MAREMRLAIIATAISALAGCGDSEIDTVKNSFYSDAETVSMGNLLDNRHICSSVTWDVFETKQKTKTVEYRCYLSGATDFFTDKLKQEKLEREKRNERDLPQAKKRLQKRLKDRQIILDEIANLPEDQKSTILQNNEGHWKREDTLQSELNDINRLVTATKKSIHLMETPFEGEMQFKDIYELWQWGFNKDGIPILTYGGYELIKPDNTSQSLTKNPREMFLYAKKEDQNINFNQYRLRRLYNL